MRSFSDIIQAFGGVVPFRDAMGLPDVNARQMKQRDSIPDGYWSRVVAEATARNIEGVSLDVLAEIAAGKLKQKFPARAEAAQ